MRNPTNTAADEALRLRSATQAIDVTEASVGENPTGLAVTESTTAGGRQGLLALRQIAITRALIELEKPAHTDYELDWIYPTMQIGVHSTVGVDTLLGTVTGT